MTTTTTIEGIEVLSEGEGEHVVVMIHGWPDTHRLWDATVTHLTTTFAGQLRCVRFTLPGFDVAKPARPMSLQQLVDTFAAIIDDASPGRPVTLLLHDWGCVFGYEYLAQHPHRVARLVAVDIGDHNSGALLRSLTTKARLQVLAYQGWLALAWKLGQVFGDALGNRMTRGMARALRCRSDPALIGWQMNYPYYAQWLRAWGGYQRAAQVAPACPMLYVYGQRKPFQFQSQRWLDTQAARQGCEVRPFRTGHWVMVEQPQAFNQCVGDWLARTPAASA